ncbi:MAG TPA: thiamine-phosphate kinase [Microbacteriaceae bacterium]|nr:thiamine-phosphate kinase [Microbacteriaceae bacterium]
MSASDGTAPRAGALAETVAQLGEEAVLRRLTPLLPVSGAASLGIGDDAAVVAAPDGRFVVTTDMMVEGPDFRTAWSTPFDLGWKAAATNLSDVAAMGARPSALVVALAVAPDTALRRLEDFARGLAAACLALAPSCGVVGGDLSTSVTHTITVTALGDLEGRAPVTRAGARPGDVVAYCGELGLAGRGLRLLFEQGVDGNGRPDRSRAEGLRRLHRTLIDAQLRPAPPIASGPVAARAGAHAMMDVSDGLAKDARRLARASGVSVIFDREALGDDPEMAMRGGEDHGLLATFAPTAPLPEGFRRLGRAGPADRGARVWVGRHPYRDDGGWDPYRDASRAGARDSHDTTVSP